MIDMAIQGWAATAANDPEALAKSLPQLKTITNSGLQSAFVKGLLAGVDAPTFRDTVRKATALLGKLPPSLTTGAGVEDNNAVVAEILDQWLAPPPDHALGMPGSHPRDSLEIYRFATEEIADSKLRWKAQQLALGHLARLDPEQAANRNLNYCCSFPPGLINEYFQIRSAPPNRSISASSPSGIVEIEAHSSPRTS